MPHRDRSSPVRYAVVGAGHIAQVAVLPAFANAENSRLVGLVSRDEAKHRELGRRYDLEAVVTPDHYEALLSSGKIDAVYVAVPNHLHCDYTIRAARHGVHVLCEKPMAVTQDECEAMRAVCDEHGVALMIAYRLHFDPANLEAIEIVRSGEIGEPRFFTSTFSQDVEAGNVRLAPVDRGGGPVFDMGVYCTNAARYLFRDEPEQVSAVSGSRNDERFVHSPETVSATLSFSRGRVANFVVSFGATRTARYEVVGARGRLLLEQAYEYAKPMMMTVQTDEGTRIRRFEKTDQFGPQLVYFSECIQAGRRPEPDAYSGRADVRVVRAIHESARAHGQSIHVDPIEQPVRPDASQSITRPSFEKPSEVNAESPSGN